jgi:glycosyltransferase involved in cell wall biosynthesis
VWFAPLSPWAIKAFYPLADVVSAVSQGVLDDLSEISSRAVRNGHVIYNPVVSDELMEASRQEVSHPWFEEESNVPVLLGVGRMDPQKNFVLLVRAFAKLNHHCEARLVILGDGNERGKLKALVRELGVEDKVDFIGFKDNPYKYMANASLFVLSSNFEGLPTVLIEALACGCPVVSTDCPSGPHEILEGGKWGRLVPVGDEEALAEAMQEALSEPHDPDRLRQRAMDFTADRVVDDYLDVFFPSRVTRNKAQRAA